MLKDRTFDMTEGSPTGGIVRFALPLVMGYILQQMYLVVDAAIVGRWLGVESLAAVGASTSIMFLIMGFCNGVCWFLDSRGAVVWRQGLWPDAEICGKGFTRVGCVGCGADVAREFVLRWDSATGEHAERGVRRCLDVSFVAVADDSLDDGLRAAIVVAPLLSPPKGGGSPPLIPPRRGR